jgi:hypothetical protein
MPRGRPRKKESALLKSAELIGWALGGLEREIAATRQRLAALTEQASELRANLGQGATRAAEAVTGALPGKKRGRRKKRTMSAEARKAISEKMKKRWAERKKALVKAIDKRKG